MPPGLVPDGGLVWLAVNPTSGRGRGARLGVAMLDQLRTAGFDAHVVIGTDAEDLQRRLAEAVQRECQALVVVGGDGMVHDGVNAVAGTSTALGIVAAGSGNDFARLLGLPLLDPAAALRGLLVDPVYSIDAGRLDDRWFAGVASAGFDSAANERGNRMKGVPRRIKYEVAMLAELGAFQPLELTLTLDGAESTYQAMLVAIGNGISYGGGMKICPDARIDDGIFHVTVVEQISRAELLRVFPTVYSGRHVAHPKVHVFQATDVIVDADTVAYADGERIGPLPQHARCIARAVRIVAPPLTQPLP